MQVRLSTATRVKSGATLSSTREILSTSSRLSCGLHFAVACGGVRAQRRQTRTALLCRTGVIHDPVKQTCIFDTEWSSGSSGGGRRLVEVIEPVECAVDPSEVTHELGEVKMELSEVKQQLRIAERAADDMKRKAEQVAEDMKRQVEDMSEELREVKALLKHLATAQ